MTRNASSYDRGQMGNGLNRPRRLSRRGLAFLVACAAVVVVVAPGSAQGSSPYTVKLTVCSACGPPPTAIGPGHHFQVKAVGTSSKTSQLAVFNASPTCDIGATGCTTGAPKCAKNAKAESTLHAHQIISAKVTHSFTKTKTALASSHTNTAYVCAYLTSGSRTLAHTGALYTIVVGGY